MTTQQHDLDGLKALVTDHVRRVAGRTAGTSRARGSRPWPPARGAAPASGRQGRAARRS